jgi:probable addiction module antidote protein
MAFSMAGALATGDSPHIAKSVCVVARAKVMAEIASQAGPSREELNQSFSENGNPSLKTTLAVKKAMRIELIAEVPDAAQEIKNKGTAAVIASRLMIASDNAYHFQHSGQPKC